MSSQLNAMAALRIASLTIPVIQLRPALLARRALPGERVQQTEIAFGKRLLRPTKPSHRSWTSLAEAM